MPGGFLFLDQAIVAGFADAFVICRKCEQRPVAAMRRDVFDHLGADHSAPFDAPLAERLAAQLNRAHRIDRNVLQIARMFPMHSGCVRLAL
jgi:hypothetical protein